MPQRIKDTCSAWISRAHCVVLLRGLRFDDRRVRYIMQLGDVNTDGEAQATVWEVPAHLAKRYVCSYRHCKSHVDVCFRALGGAIAWCIVVCAFKTLRGAAAVHISPRGRVKLMLLGAWQRHHP